MAKHSAGASGEPAGASCAAASSSPRSRPPGASETAKSSSVSTAGWPASFGSRRGRSTSGQMTVSGVAAAGTAACTGPSSPAAGSPSTGSSSRMAASRARPPKSGVPLRLTSSGYKPGALMPSESNLPPPRSATSTRKASSRPGGRSPAMFVNRGRAESVAIAPASAARSSPSVCTGSPRCTRTSSPDSVRSLPLNTWPVTVSTPASPAVTRRGDIESSSTRTLTLLFGWAGWAGWARAAAACAVPMANPITSTASTPAATAARVRPPERARSEPGRPILTWTFSRRLRQQLVGQPYQPPLVGVGQPAIQLAKRHPSHLGDLHVLVAQLAADRLHQEVVHGFVHPAVLGDEPVVDSAQRRKHPPGDAGLLRDLADRGLLRRLAGLDVTLGQRPQQPPAPVQPADERSAGPAGVHDEPAGRRFVNGT